MANTAFFKTLQEVRDMIQQYDDGLITDDELENKMLDEITLYIDKKVTFDDSPKE